MKEEQGLLVQQEKIMGVLKSGINLKKIIQESHILILPMFLADRFSHENEAVFCWTQGFFFIGLAYGKLQCYRVG